MHECVGKIEVLAERMQPEQWLEVDGGIAPNTAGDIVAAGANVLVAGSAIFRSAGVPGYRQNIDAIRSAAKQV